MEDATSEAEQAAHALAFLSSHTEQAASAEQPIPAQLVSTNKDSRDEEDALEYIRRKMALLQQQSHASTQQLQQQMAWLRQQMFSVVTKVRTLGADQDEAGEEELESLELLLQQSISLLQFTEGKLELMRESLWHQRVHPQELPPPTPFPSCTPFPPTTHCAPPWIGFPHAQPPLAACPPLATLPPASEHAPPPPTQPVLAEQSLLLGQHPVSALPSTNMRDERGGLQSRTASGPGVPRMRLLSEAFITRCGFWPSGKHGKSSAHTQQDALDSTEGASGDVDSFDDLEGAQDVLESPASQHMHTAFDFFCAKAHADIKASNPKTTMRDVAEALSHLWKDAKPEQRKAFEETAALQHHMMPVVAHQDPPRDGTSPNKGLVSRSNGGPVPQVAPPGQPASLEVHSTAFPLFSSHRRPHMLPRTGRGTSRSVQKCLEPLGDVMRTEDRELWDSEAQDQVLQEGHAVPNALKPEAGVAEDEIEREDDGKEDMEDDEDGREDMDMEQEQEPVQEATVMVRGGHSASSRNHVQRIPISTSMLQKTYCFPRNKAAKYLGVCPNVLKRICRDYRIERWPFRKLQSLDHLIKNAQEQASLDPNGTKEIVNELQRMKTEIFADPNLELDDRIKKLQRVNYKNDYKLRQHKGTNNGRGRKKHKSSGRWIAQSGSLLNTPEREVEGEDEDEEGGQKDGDEEQKDDEELRDLLCDEEDGDEDGDLQLDEQQTHLQPQQCLGQQSQGRQVSLVGPGAAPFQPPVVTASVPPVRLPSVKAWSSPPEQVPAVMQGQAQQEAAQVEQMQSEMHRDCSRSPSWEEGHTSVTMQPPAGKLNTPGPLAENEIVPRISPGHSLKGNLHNTLGGDFVDENGCIDGIHYEPEMVMRLSTGGEERTLRRSMLARVFHLPIQTAAESLGMSTSWLKKISRSFCIDRWPYRKLQSLDHLLESVEEQAGADPDGAAEIIKELRQIKKEIYSNPDAQLDSKIKRLRQANYKLEYKLRHNELPLTASGACPLGTAVGREERTRSLHFPMAFGAQPANPHRRAKLPPEQQSQGQPPVVATDKGPQDAGVLTVHVPEHPPASSTAQQPFPPELPPSSPEAMAAAAAAAVADLISPAPSQQRLHAKAPELGQQLPPQEQQEQWKQQTD